MGDVQAAKDRLRAAIKNFPDAKNGTLVRLHKEAVDDIRTVLDAVPQWQDIKTAPKDGTKIDLFYPATGRDPDSWWSYEFEGCADGCWCSETDEDGPSTCLNQQPSHWMPRPAPPIGKDCVVGDVRPPDAETRLIASGMIDVIDRKLPEWRKADPSAMSYVEVPRGCLLALAECARAYLLAELRKELIT